MRDPKSQPLSQSGKPLPVPPAGMTSESSRATAAQPDAAPYAAGRELKPRLTPMEANKSSVGPAPARHARGGIVGLAARTAHGAQMTGTSRVGRTPASVVATLNRALAQVDMRLVALLMQPQEGETNLAGRCLEIALLARVHSTIAAQMGQVQDDAVLIDSLAEYADAAAQTVVDLEAGGARSLDRWLDFLRELVGELAALGGEAGVYRQALRTLRGHLAPQRQAERADAAAATASAAAAAQGALDVWCHSAADIYTQLSRAVGAQGPQTPTTLLDVTLNLTLQAST